MPDRTRSNLLTLLLVCFLIVFAVALVSGPPKSSTEGFYWTGSEDMPFSVSGTSTFYLGGARYVTLTKGGKYGIEAPVEFTGERPSSDAMQAVFDHCFRQVVRENITLGRLQYTDGNITYICKTVIKFFGESRPGQSFALYPYDNQETIPLWTDRNLHGVPYEVPAGTVVQVVDVYGPLTGYFHVSLNGTEYFTSNDVVKFIVPS